MHDLLRERQIWVPDAGGTVLNFCTFCNFAPKIVTVGTIEKTKNRKVLYCSNISTYKISGPELIYYGIKKLDFLPWPKNSMKISILAIFVQSDNF